MSDTKSGDDNTLSVNPKKTLTLKRPGLETGTVRQNFSHGRTKSVVVETKKRKFSMPGDKPEPVAASVFSPKPQPVAPTPVVAAPAPVVVQEAPKPQPPVAERSGMVLKELSAGELEARRRALQGSHARESEDRQRALDEAKRRQEDEERRRIEREASARRQAEEEARLQKEAEARKRAEEEARRRAPQAADLAASDDESETKSRTVTAARGAPVRRIVTPEVARPTKTKGEEDRRRGKLTLSSATSEEEARARSLSSMRRRQEKFKRAMHNEPREKVVRDVVLPETITIQELAQRMSERAVDVVKYFMKQGQILKPGDVIDADTAELVASEFGHTVRRVAESDIEEGLFDVADSPEDMVPVRRWSRSWAMSITARPRCSTRSAMPTWSPAKPAASRSISAPIRSRRTVRRSPSSTRPATPPLRPCVPAAPRRPTSRSSWLRPTIRVMPQTIESISHAKAAGVPIIVAINKIDKPQADAQKVRTQLLQHEVFVESMGGEVLDVEVSATKGTNLDQLLEAILLQAELLDLKANPDRTSEGVVIEAKLERAAARSRPCSCRPERSWSATSSSPAASGAAFARWSTTRARISKRPRRRCRSKSSACRARRRRATASPWSTTRRAPARSPSTVSARRARRPLPSMSASAVRWNR